MKTNIINILDDHFVCYEYQRGEDGEIKVLSQEAIETDEKLTQLMCDAAVHQMWYFGRWPEGFILLTNAQHAFLLNQGFSEEQIKKARGNSDNLKEHI